jgi:hypothetical protein
MGEYVSLIFSRALGKKVEPSELETPAYHDLVNRFIGSGKDETFHLPKSTPDGKKTQVIIGVPGWLATRVRGSAPM